MLLILIPLVSLPLDKEKKPEKHVNQMNRLNQTLALSPVSSFGPQDMVAIDMAVSAGQPVVTNQVP